MKIKEPEFMQELHKIREEMHRETKGLNWKEKAKWMHREAERSLKTRRSFHR